MKCFVKMIVPLLLFLFSNPILPGSSALADQLRCPLAISRSVADTFPEIRTILNDLKQSSGNNFGYYEESPVDLLECLRDFPTDRFKMLITTSSELEKIPDRWLSRYDLEEGRPLKVEFLLVGNEKKTLMKLQSPKVAHASDESLMNFYVDIFLGCVYQGATSENKPTDRLYKRGDWTPDGLRNRNLLIIKYFPTIDFTVGMDLLHSIRRLTTFPNIPIPIPYCDKGHEPEFRTMLLPCFEEVSKRCSTVQVNYEFQLCPNLAHFANAIGVRADLLRSEITSPWDVQAITKNENIAIVNPKEYSPLRKEFFSSLYDRCMDIKYRHIRKPEDSELSLLISEYRKALYILSARIRGVIEFANFYFDDALQAHDEIDSMWGIGDIRNQLTQNKDTLSEDQLDYIKKTVRLFEEYFAARELATNKKHVDSNLLRAKHKATQLLYFLHHHYFNAQAKAVEAERASEMQSLSANYLSLCQEMLKSWIEHIDTVKTEDLYDYRMFRRKELFHDHMELSEKFKGILDIR